MKKSSINKLILLLLLGVSAFTTSCTRRDLETPLGEGQVNLSFDWKNLVSGDVLPSGMKLCFYRSDGVVITKDCSASGFTGVLPLGTYQVLAYNVGSSGINYRDMNNYSNASVYVSSASKSTLIDQPYYFYGIGLSSLTVSADNAASATMTPLPFVKKAQIKIDITGGFSSVSSCSCTLDGLADAVKIATGEIQGSDGFVSFVPKVYSGGYESMVLFFGRIPTAHNVISIVLNFVEGGSQTINIDVSSELSKLKPSVTSVGINVKIDVGDTPTGIKGFLKDWNVVDKNLIVY
jgi:hypothetical protein